MLKCEATTFFAWELKASVKFSKASRTSSTHGNNKTSNYDSRRHLRDSQNCPVREIQHHLQKTKENGKSGTVSRNLVVALVSRADCGDREDEWVREIFFAHMQIKKIARKLLAQKRSPQDAYE